jgi:hypothetical protein
MLITVTPLAFWRIKISGKTQARIEVCGNDIFAFDDNGNLISEENMREIAIVYRSSSSRADSLLNQSSPDFFHVLFTNGALITFHEHYDNHFILLKILHVRTGVDPCWLDWSDFQMLSTQSMEGRTVRASEANGLN